ncbi:MAG: sigma-70 family RNA polymerase sigma factor [Fusobacteriaceae bacterium]
MNLNNHYLEYLANKITLEELLVHSTKLIQSTIWKLLQRNSDDLMQEGYIATMSAVKGYEANNTYTFVTYLVNSVRWHIQRYVWSDQMVKKPKYLYEKDIDRTPFQVGSLQGIDIDYLDTYNTGSNVETSAINECLLKDALSVLTPRQKKIVLLRSVGFSFERLGGMMRLSRTRIMQIERESVKLMRVGCNVS